MGLIKAAIDATRTSIGDQFKEFVTCPSTGNDVIIQRGLVNHGKDNKTFSEGVISNGSGIEVPQGMAMMIVDNGKIVEFTADPGLFKYDTSSEPSVFTGGLGKGIIDTIKTIGSRITYGGQPAKDQRVYYVNIKNLPGIPFGSTQPETVYDSVYGSVEITYNGEFMVKVDNPVILINNVLGAQPSKDTMTIDDIFVSDHLQGGNILKTRFSELVSGAITDIMANEGVSYNRIGTRKAEISKMMNEALDEDWYQKYGIIVSDVGIRINASEEAKQRIAEIDKARGFVNVDAERVGKMADAYSTPGAMDAARGEALLNASKNEAGSLGGFVGMGAAAFAGAKVAETATASQAAPTGNTAGATSFCSNCGAPVNGGNFCTNCGNKLN